MCFHCVTFKLYGSYEESYNYINIYQCVHAHGTKKGGKRSSENAAYKFWVYILQVCMVQVGRWEQVSRPSRSHPVFS